jgi:hypothetical protein
VQYVDERNDDLQSGPAGAAEPAEPEQDARSYCVTIRAA